MDTAKVIQDVEQYINGEIEKPIIGIEAEDNTLNRYLKRTAKRLIITYEKYLLQTAGVSDYLCCLRNFMLAYRTFLRIDDKEILENNHFGIKRAENGYQFYAVEDLPSFVNSKVVLNGFVTKDTTLPKEERKYLLQTNQYISELTGFKEFKTVEQKLCVYGALNTPKGYTTLVSMPTGGGKSLITQTLAYKEEGLTIVVVPTISLAIDQVKATADNITHDTSNEVFCYYSGIKNANQIISAIDNKSARLLFISPEALLLNNKFKESIFQANKERYLKNLVIDEAHIVIAWGDYFRVDYQCLEPWRKDLLKSNPDLRTILLSATFTDNTVKNLKSMFSQNGRWIEIRCDSLRKEPRFNLIKSSYKTKKSFVLNLVNKLPHPMIIYVNSPEDAVYWKDYLNKYGYDNVQMFTGDTRSDERERLIKLWRNDEFDTMIATSAFGVGVSKPDVRTVLHLYIPESPDAYYQELGRGGRDGLPCLSVMCINEAEDIEKGYSHITKVLKPETIYDRWWTMLNDVHNVRNGSIIAVDTSIKPDHSKMGIFEPGNKKDRDWNINLLLLLRRNNAIRINNIQLIPATNKYQITIEILNPVLLKDEQTVLSYFTEIREKEVNRSLSLFKYLETAIKKSDSICWSEMFYNTYPLVSEYCAGCNHCEKLVFDRTTAFPLIKPLSEPKKELSSLSKSLFGDTKEVLVFKSTETTDVYKLLTRYSASVLVTDEAIELSGQSDNKTLNIMNFQEFNNLLNKGDYYYLTGLIVALYDCEKKDVFEKFRIMHKYLSKSNGYIMHILDHDWEIQKLGRNISELVDGAVLQMANLLI